MKPVLRLPLRCRSVSAHLCLRPRCPVPWTVRTTVQDRLARTGQAGRTINFRRKLMELLWPGSLYLLGLIPLLIIFYIWILRRRRRYAVRYSSLSLVRQALPQSSRWRRHLPFALFLLALSVLIVAFSRPQTQVIVPSRRATILLAIDVSRSMCSNDIPPNRLEATEDAAFSFVE